MSRFRLAALKRITISLLVALITLSPSATPVKVEAKQYKPQEVYIRPIERVRAVKKLDTPIPRKQSQKSMRGPAQQPPARKSSMSGSKTDWMRAAGIPESDWWAVDFIVSRESNWNPCSFYPGMSDCNASPSTACGLVQQNPCGKIPGHWTDPVAALRWQKSYVTERYGGYPQAVEFWKANHAY